MVEAWPLVVLASGTDIVNRSERQCSDYSVDTFSSRNKRVRSVLVSDLK